MPGRIIRTAAVCALFIALGPLTLGEARASGPDIFGAPTVDPDATLDRLIQPPPKYDLWSAPDGLSLQERAHTDLPDEPEHTDLPDEPEALIKPIFVLPRGQHEFPNPFDNGGTDEGPGWLTSPYEPLPPMPDSGSGGSGAGGGGSTVPSPGAAMLLTLSACCAGSRRRRRS
jgi:hypothetical protein